ncbi:GDSL-like Lipase/Acylhydrolase [Apiospora phragmitis]|uniref:GDSL-like Lipase/Acylhydrolase n=1 Tax=Apiospora phragmitis TaxID=2905665 RepID=A0ABR1VGK9_9PEZI
MLSSKSVLALWCLCSAVTGLAIPKVETREADAKLALANGLPLRIMPLGASITFGTASSDGNGYRQTLRNKITASGNPVNMVGSHPNGTMKDNENEGWPGFVIDEVHDKSNQNVPITKPNLVLINAGTNDALQNRDVDNAGARITSMINDIFTQSPQATVVLSSLIPNANTDAQSRAVKINSQYDNVVNTLRGQGRRVVFANMQSAAGPTLGDLVQDGTHPTDAGYVKMANVWMDAIVQASLAGFLQKAEPLAGFPDDGGA